MNVLSSHQPRAGTAATRPPARDNNGHIHPVGHFCGSNCPMHKPRESSAATVPRPPSFWRTLFAPRRARAETDAYGEHVFRSKGFTPNEARRAMAEIRAAVRGVPHSPWFKERWKEAQRGKP